MGLVESIDFVFHIFTKGIDLFFDEPVDMKVAPSFVFDEVFVLASILSFSSP